MIGILRTVLEGAVDGAVVLDLCTLGDTLILEETNKVYKREKEMKKGTCNESCHSLLLCISVLSFSRNCFSYLCLCRPLCLPFLSS